MSDGKNALLAGATGLVGGHCLEALLVAERYQRVIVLGRRPVDRAHPKLEQIRVDFGELAAEAAPHKVDDAYCCLGTTLRKAGSRAAFRRVDHDYVLAVAHLARAWGARQFLLVSSVGADPAGSTFYLRVKGEVEHALDGLGFSSVIVLRPSLLLGHRTELRFAERAGQVAFQALTPLLRGRWRRLRPVHAHDVAACLVRVAGTGLQGTHIIESERIDSAPADRL